MAPEERGLEVGRREGLKRERMSHRDKEEEGDRVRQQSPAGNGKVYFREQGDK